MDERRDRDQGGGGQNDAEESEETPQLVLAQGVEGDARGFPEGGAEAEFASCGHDMGLSEGRASAAVCSAMPLFWTAKGAKG